MLKSSISAFQYWVISPMRCIGVTHFRVIITILLHFTVNGGCQSPAQLR